MPGPQQFNREAHPRLPFGWLHYYGLGVAMCFAADPQLGTWKLNEAKSKITPGTMKFTTVTSESMLGNIKVASDGTDSNGRPAHVEWSGKFDGKDYPVTGSPDSDARSYTKVNDRTLQITAKKNGKVVASDCGRGRWQKSHFKRHRDDC